MSRWASLILIVVVLCALGLLVRKPVPHCKIVDGREIVDHHCIPYCPPDPKECG